ncbi:MAG: 7-cyano-7-deazaguanine synthase [Acidobacteria bacterium]|nr:7-cyano-7-deazaguanine synthase [Acidobacteriota bacterium]
MMIAIPLPPPAPESLVLCSGGLDSVVLAAYEARERRVQPVYVSAGLWWETSELETLRRILRGPAFQPRVRPPVELTFDVRDIYPSTHWAIQGTPPAYDTPDEEVYLVGRNVTLLSKAAVFAAQRKIRRIALGPLAGNPFPDATPEFFEAMARSLSLGLGQDLAIVTPFLTLHKADVIKLGHSLGVPLELTLSCMSPTDGLHCGTCSKCRERRDAFDEAGVPDKTTYAMPSPRG